MRWIAGFLIGFGLSVLAVLPSRAADDAAWQALRDGHAFAIMRHAIAPGFSDPGNFDEQDCATQRNLSEEGRQQAREIGAIFRENGVDNAEVWTSVWCRCRETAKWLDIGEPRDLRSLNSFFEHRSRGDPQTEALSSWLDEHDTTKPLVLVTHQVNISALLGVATRSGETLIAQRDPKGGFRVLGSF